MLRAPKLLAAVACLMAVASACTNGQSPDRPHQEADLENEKAHDEFRRLLIRDIDIAQEAGAHTRQIAILEVALQSGEIAFAEYNGALDQMLRCITATGFDPTDLGIIESDGLRMRQYGVPAAAENADPREAIPGVTVHRCVVEHSYWVEIAYQVQPSSVRIKERYWEQFRDALIACYDEQGIDVEPDERITDIIRIGAASYSQGKSDIDCLTQVGL